MGAASSVARPRVPAPPVIPALAQLALGDTDPLGDLPEPFEAAGSTHCFYAMPLPDTEELSRKLPVVVLEVSGLGFRLLRPGSFEPLSLYAWGQVHSWAHAGTEFAFRHYDESKTLLQRYAFRLRDIQLLLEQIQLCIDSILGERKRLAITPEGYEQCLGRLNATDPEQRVDVLAELVKENYFFSQQGVQFVRCMPNPFDKVDAAVLLHGRLVDQTGFSKMLEDSDCQGDKANIWARITQLRKKRAGQSGRSGDSRR